MDEPQGLGPALSETAPIAVGASDAADALLDREVPVRQIGQWGLVWRRFSRHRLAVWGARILILLAAIAVVGPLIAPSMAIDYPHASLGPRLWPLGWRIFGTTSTGIPVLAYVVVGARGTLAIGVFGSLIASIIGTVLGIISGYFGRVVDVVLMRIVDAFLTVPFLPLLVMISLYLPDHGILLYVLIFGLTGWAGVARLVRSYCLSIKEREYTEAARALGASDLGIAGRHILPNTLDILVVSFTLNIALFIVAEASLAFLNAGPQDITWGVALAGGYSGVIAGSWWMFAFPGAALLLTVLAVNFLGDGLRDALENTAAGYGLDPTTEPEPEREPGPLLRAVFRAGRSLTMAGAGACSAVSASTARLRVPDRPHLPRAEHRMEQGRAVLRQPAPGILRFGPIGAMFLAGGVAFLGGHSPLHYAPNYPAPAQVATAAGPTEYAAWPLSSGRWDLFFVDHTSRVAYERVSASGQVLRYQALAPGDSTSSPWLAENGGRIVGVWSADGETAVHAAYVGARPSQPFVAGPPGGTVDHPYVFPTPGGGFAVLFQWQRNGSSSATFDIYLATLPPGARKPSTIRRIARSPQYGFYPRGVADGSGAFDIAWMERSMPGIWTILFRRFSVQGHPLGPVITLDQVNFVKPLSSGQANGEVVPAQWGMDLKRAADGSVWMAWEGNNSISVAHWSRTGHLLLPPTVVLPFGIDSTFEAVRAVALALEPGGGQVYHTFIGDVGTYVAGLGFDDRGRAKPQQPERLNYDGGLDYNPRAGTVGTRPAIMWQRGHHGAAILEATHYHPYQGPDLLTRLGLNIGNVWANIALIVFGALAAGVGITIVNAIVVAPLILIWLPIGRLGRFFPPPVGRLAHLAVIAVVLALLFGVRPDPPGYVLVISGLGMPYRWFAVAGAVFVSFWGGRFVFERQEPLFRAALMVFAAFYFVAVMYALTLIQGELGTI